VGSKVATTIAFELLTATELWEFVFFNLKASYQVCTGVGVGVGVVVGVD
jgi:hypothetical protein